MHWADLQWTGIQSRRNKSILSPLQPYRQGLGEGRRETLETRLSALMLLAQGYFTLLGKMENCGLMDVPLQRRERDGSRNKNSMTINIQCR